MWNTVQMLPLYCVLLCTRFLSADEVNKAVPAVMIYAHRTKRKKKKLRQNLIRKAKQNKGYIRNHRVIWSMVCWRIEDEISHLCIILFFLFCGRVFAGSLEVLLYFFHSNCHGSYYPNCIDNLCNPQASTWTWLSLLPTFLFPQQIFFLV